MTENEQRAMAYLYLSDYRAYQSPSVSPPEPAAHPERWKLALAFVDPTRDYCCRWEWSDVWSVIEAALVEEGLLAVDG